MSKKRQRAQRRRERPLPSGICHVCGCTDERGCDVGCSWADEDCTICSACQKWASRASAAGANMPSQLPVYGLWIVDGGPRSLGHWLVETDNSDNGYPAVYFDRVSAETAAKAERDDGLDVFVVELRASDRSKP